MKILRQSVLVVLCISISIVSSCDSSSNSHSSSTSTREPLINGTHYSISNVNTGWTASNDLMMAFVEFDISNNGTEDISVMTLVALFMTPYSFGNRSEALGTEQTRTITNFDSGDSRHYRFVSSNGYGLSNGAWGRMTDDLVSPAMVGIGIMYPSETRVSDDNLNAYEISNSNVE